MTKKYRKLNSVKISEISGCRMPVNDKATAELTKAKEFSMENDKIKSLDEKMEHAVDLAKSAVELAKSASLPDKEKSVLELMISDLTKSGYGEAELKKSRQQFLDDPEQRAEVVKMYMQKAYDLQNEQEMDYEDDGMEYDDEDDGMGYEDAESDELTDEEMFALQDMMEERGMQKSQGSLIKSRIQDPEAVAYLEQLERTADTALRKASQAEAQAQSTATDMSLRSAAVQLDQKFPNLPGDFISDTHPESRFNPLAKARAYSLASAVPDEDARNYLKGLFHHGNQIAGLMEESMGKSFQAEELNNLPMTEETLEQDEHMSKLSKALDRQKTKKSE